MRIQIGLVLLLLSHAACDYNSPEDYNPKKDFNEFMEEQKKESASFKESVKQIDPAVAAAAEAKKTYGLYCASCHGADGMANTPTAASLNPKPRNFADAKWQDSVDDAHIAKVIKEGGPSVGLSPTMAAWGAAINDEQIKGLVKLVRTFKK